MRLETQFTVPKKDLRDLDYVRKMQTLEKNLKQKINNIGHSDIAKEDPFFQNWKHTDLKNWDQLKNFKTSGFGNNQWPKLVCVETHSLRNVAESQLQLAYWGNYETRNNW